MDRRRFLASYEAAITAASVVGIVAPWREEFENVFRMFVVRQATYSAPSGRGQHTLRKIGLKNRTQASVLAVRKRLV